MNIDKQIRSIDWLDGYSKRACMIDLYDGRSYIRSYNTTVACIDNYKKVHRYWHDWSATTMKHINIALQTRHCDTMNKKAWVSMDVEDMDATARAVDKWYKENIGTCILDEYYGWYRGFRSAER